MLSPVFKVFIDKSFYISPVQKCWPAWYFLDVERVFRRWFNHSFHMRTTVIIYHIGLQKKLYKNEVCLRSIRLPLFPRAFVIFRHSASGILQNNSVLGMAFCAPSLCRRVGILWAWFSILGAAKSCRGWRSCTTISFFYCYTSFDECAGVLSR